MNFCRNCGVKLVCNENWYISNEKQRNHICNNCHNMNTKKYRESHKERYNYCSKKYKHTDKGKKVHNRHQRKYYRENIAYCLDYAKKYRQTEKGKEISKKQNAKRKRNLGWTKLFENPFDEKVEIHWHHYNNEYVVALPKDIHISFLGKNHRENLKPIMHQIYLGW